jgi:SAM-dependent methyltransferase
MTRIDPDHCPACGGSSQNEFLYIVNKHSIYRCVDCGIGRTGAADFDRHSYYSEKYFSGGRSDGYADYAGSQSILRKEFRKLVGFVRGLTRGDRLLEVGCAYGFFLQEARKYFDVSGIEISDSATQACRDSGLNVNNAELTASALEPLGRFDAIVLLDVIEHLPDPAESFRLFNLHLNPGGIVILTTGDFASLMATIAGKRWRLMTPPQHLWFFTPASLRLFAASNGLTVESIEHPWKLVPLSLIGFQLRRMAGLGGGPFSIPDIAIPLNLFDAMRVVLRKNAT